MNISDLKKGFWGYRKEGVYQYIAALNEEFAGKLEENNEKNLQLVGELRERNAELEKELEVLRAENREYRTMQLAVSNAIVDAHKFAEQLKNESREKQQVLHRQIEEERTLRQMELKDDMDEIEGLRTELKTVLERMDTTLSQAQHRAGALEKQIFADTDSEPEEKAPAETAGLPENVPAAGEEGAFNMSLFQRKEKASRGKVYVLEQE